MAVASLTGRGRAVAELLAGSWRPAPVAAEGADLDALAPLLLRGGAAALAWRRLSPAQRRDPSAAELQQAYRLQLLRAELHTMRVAGALARLRRVGIDPVLAKGWAIAARYPEPALRPYGDIDLYVASADYARAAETLRRHQDDANPVDLHRGVGDAGADERAVLARTVRVAIDGENGDGGGDVRLFADEDHLRLLALHLLRHGAWRPLWLCDIAVAVESAGAGFDWARLLDGDGRGWVGGALALARELLGARLPAEVAARSSAPTWLATAVLRQWGDATFTPQGTRTPFVDSLSSPRALWSALRQRWPNPIEATLGVGAGFDERPRLPLQLADCVRRTVGFARQLVTAR